MVTVLPSPLPSAVPAELWTDGQGSRVVAASGDGREERLGNLAEGTISPEGTSSSPGLFSAILAMFSAASPAVAPRVPSAAPTDAAVQPAAGVPGPSSPVVFAPQSPPPPAPSSATGNGIGDGAPAAFRLPVGVEEGEREDAMPVKGALSAEVKRFTVPPEGEKGPVLFAADPNDAGKPAEIVVADRPYETAPHAGYGMAPGSEGEGPVPVAADPKDAGKPAENVAAAPTVAPPVLPTAPADAAMRPGAGAPVPPPAFVSAPPDPSSPAPPPATGKGVRNAAPEIARRPDGVEGGNGDSAVPLNGTLSAQAKRFPPAPEGEDVSVLVAADPMDNGKAAESAASRPGKPAPPEGDGIAAVPAPGGKASAASREAGSGDAALPAGPPEAPGPAAAPEKKRETAGRVEERAEPAVPPAAAERVAAEKAAAPRPEPSAPASKIFRYEEHAFQITRKSDTSVEVTLSPPGVGKLEIEVSLEKGAVHARITAADTAGRDAIERSLPHIVEALARDGMNVGGFSVSLKSRRDRPGDAPAALAPRDGGMRSAPVAPAAAVPAGLVDIFV